MRGSGVPPPRQNAQLLLSQHGCHCPVPSPLSQHCCHCPVPSPPSPRPQRPGSTEPPTCSRESAASPSAATAGGCLPLPLPSLSLCSEPGEELSFPPLVRSRSSGQSPSLLPGPAAVGGIGKDLPAPGTASAQRNLVSSGRGQRGDLPGAPGGLLWAPYLRECLPCTFLSLLRSCCLLLLHSDSDACSHLRHLGLCSKLPAGPGQVPSTTGTSMSPSFFFVCPQQSTTGLLRPFSPVSSL